MYKFRVTPLLRLFNTILIKLKVFMLNLSTSRVSCVISYDCCMIRSVFAGFKSVSLKAREKDVEAY